MTHEPECPDCRTPVQPTWDWCMACGYDPEWLKPAGWTPGLVTAGAPGATTALATATAAAVVAGTRQERPTYPVYVGRPAGDTVLDARPQEITEPDWAPTEPRRRMSYLGVAGLVAAIVVALGTLILVMVLVLHQPVGTKQANAAGLAPTASISGRAAAAAG